MTVAESIGQEKLLDTELSEFLETIPVGHRKARFGALADAMISVGRPVCIVETGCMRQPTYESAEGDGCSSLVWDYVATRTVGYFLTIDVNQANIDYAKTKLKTKDLYCSDSVKFLAAMQLNRPIDLLYLDSLDWVGTQLDRGLSALHHAAELSAAWRSLNEGALIAIDDCLGEYSGKHGIVKRFFESIGVQPIVDDYIHVWRKPAITQIPL